MPADLFPPIAAVPPLKPWEYLRLRRQAAGLTIAQAATPHIHRPEQRDAVENSFLLGETPGVVIKDRYLVEGCNRAFRVDADVYVQLRDLPPAQHPRVCRGCGGTAWDPAITRDGYEATIGPDMICTACVERAGAAVRKAA